MDDWLDKFAKQVGSYIGCRARMITDLCTMPISLPIQSMLHRSLLTHSPRVIILCMSIREEYWLLAVWNHQSQSLYPKKSYEYVIFFPWQRHAYLDHHALSHLPQVFQPWKDNLQLFFSLDNDAAIHHAIHLSWLLPQCHLIHKLVVLALWRLLMVHSWRQWRWRIGSSSTAMVHVTIHLESKRPRACVLSMKGLGDMLLNIGEITHASCILPSY